MKLIVNMIMGTAMASLAEGMAMAEKVGLDQEDVAEVLSLGSLSCPTVIHKSQGTSYFPLALFYVQQFYIIIKYNKRYQCGIKIQVYVSEELRVQSCCYGKRN